MNLSVMKESLGDDQPPKQLSVYQQALWYVGKKQWDKAHSLVEYIEDKNAAWIHAYLHRYEGDTGNADYWYRRAAKTRPAVSLEQEWESIVTALD